MHLSDLLLRKSPACTAPAWAIHVLVLGAVVLSGCLNADRPQSPDQDTGHTPSHQQSPAEAQSSRGASTRSIDKGVRRVFTAIEQHPLTMQFYPGSLWTTPLPPNPPLLLNSDAIVKNVYQSQDFPGGPVSCLTTTPGGSSCSSQKVLYYSDESDPVYKVVSCAHTPSQSPNNPVGKFFHLTNRAQFASNNSDQMLTDWDQSLGIDPTPGGRILSFYTSCPSGQTCPLSLPSCACTTTACANVTASCQIQQNWCDMGYPQNDNAKPAPAVGNGVAWINVGAASGAGLLRAEEICGGPNCPGAGQVNHAIFVTTACVGGSSSPSNTGALLCTDDAGVRTNTNAIFNGSLVYIDSAYDCSQLPAWQRPICVALQRYGGYVAATTGGEYGGLGMNAIEGQIAQHLAGAKDPTPFFSYLNRFSDRNYAQGVYCVGSPVTRCNVYPVQNMRGLITGDAGNGFKPHLHVVDPCVPKHMVGMQASCTGSPKD
jgi:hypothetical protein